MEAGRHRLASRQATMEAVAGSAEGLPLPPGPDCGLAATRPGGARRIAALGLDGARPRGGTKPPERRQWQALAWPAQAGSRRLKIF